MLALARALCFQPLHSYRVVFGDNANIGPVFVDRFTLDASGAVISFLRSSVGNLAKQNSLHILATPEL